MKSSNLTKAYEQAERAYEEACIALDLVRGILDAIPVTGSADSTFAREYIKPIFECATRAVENTFDVKDDLEELIEELQAVEENEI